MKHFSDIIKNNEVDIKIEYNRLFDMFYIEKPYFDNTYDEYSLYQYLDLSFMSFPFRGTCISLEDFNRTHGFIFEQQPKDFDIDYLICFCEYSYNLTIYLQAGPPSDLFYLVNNGNYTSKYLQQVSGVIEKLKYKLINKEGLNEFVPEDIVVEQIAEEADKTLAERLYEYKHHSSKGNIEKKKEILFAIYSKMSAEEKTLEKINKELSNNLAFAFNNLDIRHNNKDEGSKSFKDETASMNDNELEEWYDKLYSLCIQAILEVDNDKIIKEVEKLRKEYKK